MANLSVRNILPRECRPSTGKAVTDSNCFDGHENRMASRIHRIWNHACERTDGKRCKDCIHRKRR